MCLCPNIYMYIYSKLIHIFVCVCVCVCVQHQLGSLDNVDDNNIVIKMQLIMESINTTL